MSSPSCPTSPSAPAPRSAELAVPIDRSARMRVAFTGKRLLLYLAAGAAATVMTSCALALVQSRTYCCLDTIWQTERRAAWNAHCSSFGRTGYLRLEISWSREYCKPPQQVFGEFFDIPFGPAQMQTPCPWPDHLGIDPPDPRDRLPAVFIRTEIIAAGWPFLAARGSLGGYEYSPITGKSVNHAPADLLQLQRAKVPSDLGRDALPLRPMPLGFLANSCICALALWCLASAPKIIHGQICRLRRRCARCGYPLGSSPICPECGVPLGARVGVDRLAAACEVDRPCSVPQWMRL